MAANDEDEDRRIKVNCWVNLTAKKQKCFCSELKTDCGRKPRTENPTKKPLKIFTSFDLCWHFTFKAFHRVVVLGLLSYKEERYALQAAAKQAQLVNVVVAIELIEIKWKWI